MNVRELKEKIINHKELIPVGIEWDCGNASFEVDPAETEMTEDGFLLLGREDSRIKIYMGDVYIYMEADDTVVLTNSTSETIVSLYFV